jgi:hypothetical protein
MKKVKIGGCQYLYHQRDNEYTLYYSMGKEWAENIRGKIAFQLIDTGNGFKIPKQAKKKELDYSEACELMYLMKKVNK